MAKATANCTCATCGKEFVKTKDCCNRADANNWEDWAEKNYTECPTCYGKRMAAEEKAKPLTVTVKLQTYPPTYLFVASGDAYPHKDDLKALGYRWSEPPASGFFGLMSTRRPRKAWWKGIEINMDLHTPEELVAMLQKEMDAATGIGATVVDDISDVDYAAALQYMELDRKEAEENLAKKAEDKAREAEIQAKIDTTVAALVKPKRPSCIPDGAWNKTIYGKSSKTYCIYVDSQKIPITTEQKKEIEAWLKAMDNYKAARAAIENSIREKG